MRAGADCELLTSTVMLRVASVTSFSVLWLVVAGSVGANRHGGGGVAQNYDFPRPVGSVDAAYDLMDRILGVPEAKESIRLAVAHPREDGDDSDGGIDPEGQRRWFRLEQVPVRSLHRDGSAGGNRTTTVPTGASSNGIQIVITGTSLSELTAGLGFYFKEYCNFTLEWSTGGRAGGSHIEMPPMDRWPVPLSATGGDYDRSVTVHRDRIVPWSYLMNVCTHSYSLVWYDWPAWESLIDNLALRGINMILALTGQEEIQYKIFRRLGLNSSDVLSWFNGPAFLTWSRGQNEYGSGIAGPLPRSFMKAQWRLQREHILPRLRSLGIVGQLPAFQGNVPIQLKTLYQDANITEEGSTGWMDSLDPLYSTIADKWMKELINDFGTDHYYQIDGYFNGGTAPWLQNDDEHDRPSGSKRVKGFDTVVAFHRRGLTPVSTGSDSTAAAAKVATFQPHDDTWYRRGQAVYGGLSRTDPQAHWMYQGFSFVGWDTAEQASFLKGFVDSAPAGKFIVIDMGYSPSGEWQKWNNASFFGAVSVSTRTLI
jgi:Alpha-N-acetylglucosaminidase (NAGLU) tim-barrel domain/Alpha-N-acetylglucosaminidase (NAGLU) N-terminal domain